MQALPEFDLVLFGGTGDLATRKLIPALYRRFAAAHLAPGARIIGVGRSTLSREQYAARARESCQRHVREEFSEAT